MFIAHLSAGYLLTTYLQLKTGRCSHTVLWTGLIASIFPDFDLLYFYLIDSRQTLHHHYITHLPMAWLALAIIAWAALRFTRKAHYLIFVGIIFANTLLHMMLDSIAAEISWLYPFASGNVNLVKVPAHYGWWVWNFVLHWTFGLELLIITAAFWTWIRHAKNDSHCR